MLGNFRWCPAGGAVGLPGVLALDGSGQLGEFALVVGHLQVLDVVADVGGTAEGGGDVRVLAEQKQKTIEHLGRKV